MSFVASLSSSSGDVDHDSASAKASPSGGPSGSVQGGSSGQLGVRAGSSSGDGLSHSVNQGRSVSVDFPSAAQAVPVAGPSSASYFGVSLLVLGILITSILKSLRIVRIMTLGIRPLRIGVNGEFLMMLLPFSMTAIHLDQY